MAAKLTPTQPVSDGLYIKLITSGKTSMLLCLHRTAPMHHGDMALSAMTREGLKGFASATGTIVGSARHHLPCHFASRSSCLPATHNSPTLASSLINTGPGTPVTYSSGVLVPEVVRKYLPLLLFCWYSTVCGHDELRCLTHLVDVMALSGSGSGDGVTNRMWARGGKQGCLTAA